jgi:hypothetical protein
MYRHLSGCNGGANNMSDKEASLDLFNMRRRLSHTTPESEHSENLKTKPAFDMQLASHTAQ